MELLGLPATLVCVIVVLLLVMQLIGEALEFKGKTVPEIMRIKKYFKQRKEEHEIVAKVPQLMERLNNFISEWNERYSERNLAERDRWMNHVDERGERNKERIENIDKKLDKHSEYILSLIIENKRNSIINFASYVTNGERQCTREQFNRIFKIYNEYEEIIEEHAMTNGEVDIAYKIIVEAYEERMCNHTFVEDVRGW